MLIVSQLVEHHRVCFLATELFSQLF